MPLGKRRFSRSYTTRVKRARKMGTTGYAGVLRASIRRRPMRMRGLSASRLPSRNVHSFRRMATSTNLDLSGTEFDSAEEFSLSRTTGAAEFSALYDRYMITTVVVKFRIVNNPNSANAHNTNIAYGSNTGSNSTNWFPRLFVCPDYDDSSAESLTQLRERAKTKMYILKPNRYIKIAIKPAIAGQVYRTAASTGYAPKWNTWLDMNQNDVPHYGLKYVVDTSGFDPADTQPFRLEIERTYYFKCKDVR